jgi:hypothetical protein
VDICLLRLHWKLVFNCMRHMPLSFEFHFHPQNLQPAATSWMRREFYTSARKLFRNQNNRSKDSWFLSSLTFEEQPNCSMVHAYDRLTDRTFRTAIAATCHMLPGFPLD